MMDNTMISIREYRRNNQKWTKIQRNWQHRAHKMEKTKAKAQHNMCWKPSQFSQKYCLAYFLSL